MSVPEVTIKKVDYQTGSVGPSPTGVLAIIAAASTGTQNTPAQYSRDDLAFGDFGPSELVEDASYTLAQAGNPVVLIRPTTSTAAAYGTINTSKVTGSASITAGSTAPADNYDVLITFPNGGTVGSAGIEFTYSLDGGDVVSAVQALPTGAAPITLTIPNFTQGGSPGVSFSIGAGSLNAGDFFQCLTTHAQITNADLSTALESLRVTSLPWEGVLIDQDANSGSTGLVDAWLQSLETVGKFRMAFLNTRFKGQSNVGTGTPETETAFATAMTTAVAGMAPSIRLSLASDGEWVTSTLTGLTLPRKAALAVAARSMGIPIGVEPAFVGDGPLGNCVINNGTQPAFHNEENYPNLDQLLLTTLRSVQGGNGAYVTNGRIFSTVGSDFVLIPHVRTMNRGCETAFAILTQNLSRGVGKKPADPVTGLVYIRESDALAIEGQVNAGLVTPLQGQVNAFAFTLSRTDDLSNQSGSIVRGTLAIVSLAYIKGFSVLAGFAKTIAVAA